MIIQGQGLESRSGIIWVGSHFWQGAALSLEDITFTVLDVRLSWECQATLGLHGVWWKQQEAGIRPGIAA